MAVSAVKTEAPPAEASPKPAGKKGLIKLALIVVLVIGAGGGGYWYWSHRAHEPAQEAREAPAKPPVFLPLETFTVNLQLVDNPQFLQTAITLSIRDNAIAEEIKLNMPVVRDRILILMSSRKAAELLTVEGKRQLGEDIVASVNDVLAGRTKPATAKAADAKGADAEEETKDTKAADATDGKDAKAADGEDAKEAKAAADEEKAAAAAARPVQAVLFTSFIIQ